MKIDIILTAGEINPDKVKDKTVVVIDVLRATSVMTTAMANGANKIIPVLTPEEALDLREKMGKENVVLGGERNALPIPGFDYGNSPGSYTPDVIKDKTLIITTTNGTRAILNSLAAKKLYIGAFLNDKAIVNTIKEDEEVVFVASGTRDTFTLEDSLCAGKMAYDLNKIVDAQMSDVAIAMAALYEQNKEDIHVIASKGKHYKRVQEIGDVRDVEYCYQSDILNVVPVYTSEGTLVNKD